MFLRRVPAVACAAMLSVGACMPSQQDVRVAQALDDAAVAFEGLRQQLQDLADRVDSLQLVAARQDSTLRTLANLAGVALPP